MDSAEFSAGSNRARKDAQKLGETIQRNLGVGIDRATTALKGFAGAYLSLEGAKKFLEYADAAKSMDAQLRLATASFGTFNKAQADVNRIATVTRGGLVETTSLYGNFIRASAVLGKTQDEAARATETFSKALTIGGADANEAASATLQFGQALASGVLRGDEFNSIAEASPRILTLLADSLGVTSGSLRAMAADGKLTADVLYKALTDRKFTAGIDAEFGQLPVTFGQAMTLVNNAAIETFGAFDRGGGFSTALANFVTDGASGFADLAKSAEQFGSDTRAVFAGLDNLFDPIGANGNAIFDALGIKVYSLGEQIRSLLASVDQLRNIPIDAQNAANAFDRRVFGTQFRSDQQRSNLAGSYDQGARRSKARSRLDQSVRRLEGNGYIVPRNADGTVNEAGIRRRPTAPRPAAAPKAAGSGGKSGSSDADKAENERKRAAEKARRDEAAYEQGLSRAQSEQLQAQLDLTVDQTERVNIQQEILRQEQAGRIAAIANDQHLTDEQKAQLTLMEQKTGALKNDLLHREDVDRINRLALDRAQAQSDNELDILTAQANLARAAKERGEIERKILDQQFEMLKLVQQAALDEANRKGDKQGAELATQRLGTLDQLQKLGQDRVARDNQGPLASYLDGIPKTVAETNEAFESIAANGIGSLIDGLSQARGGFKSLAQVVSSVSNEIISSLLKITLQKSFASLFGSVLGGGGLGKYASPFASGGSSFVADSSGLPSLAGYRADGGSVIGGKSYVVGEMGPEIFTAPHSGSIIANDDISRADNRGGVMEVRLRDELLDARIISGSSRVTQAGIAQDKQQQSKFASRRLGR